MTVQVLQEDLCHLLLANNWVLKVEQKSTPLQPRSPTTQVWFLQVICFPGREQPYILVGITKISPRVIHLFQSSWAKSVWAPWRTLRDNWSSLGSEPRLQGTVTEGLLCFPLYPKLPCPLHVQTEPLVTPTALAGWLSPAPLLLQLGCKNRWSRDAAEAGYEPGWA